MDAAKQVGVPAAVPGQQATLIRVEYHLLAIGLAFIVLIHGGGKAPFDSVIQRKLTASDAKP